jgi:hypothetical protein
MTAAERMRRPLAEADPEVYSLIARETERQHSQLELIASENFSPEAVLDATASVFHQQVRRRLSQQTLSRRMRNCRPGRKPGSRPHQTALRPLMELAARFESRAAISSLPRPHIVSILIGLLSRLFDREARNSLYQAAVRSAEPYVFGLQLIFNKLMPLPD